MGIPGLWAWSSWSCSLQGWLHVAKCYCTMLWALCVSMPFWNTLQWQLASFAVHRYIRVMKLHSGTVNHWVLIHFPWQSWALSEKDWGQRNECTVPIHWQEKVIHQYRVFFLYLIWWNVHCRQFCSFSVSRTPLINRCGYWMIGGLYQPNEKCTWSLNCMSILQWKDISSLQLTAIHRLGFPLIMHFYSFPGSWSFWFVCFLF